LLILSIFEILLNLAGLLHSDTSRHGGIRGCDSW
jgi:hypothetical protein